MVIRKRLLVAGLLCTFSTTQAAQSAEPSPVESPNTAAATSSQPQGTAPPVLFAPPANAKPIDDRPSDVPDGKGKDTGKEQAAPTPAPKTASEVSPAAKLSPATSSSITNQTDKDVPPPKPIALAPSREFESLLVGESGLDGWNVHEGRPDVWHRDGNVITCRGSGGGWLHTAAEYSDFHMKFDYRLQAGCNSGLGIRCPSEGNPTFTGIELQLLDDSASKYENLRPDQYTGSLYYHAAPTQAPKLRPAGEWNSCEVICIGDLLTVKINGEVVNEVNLAKSPDAEVNETGKKKPWKLAQRPPIGHLALQSHAVQVDFRNPVIKDLSVATNSGVRYVDITDGKGDVVDGANTLTVHYVGQLLDGTRFGDTRDFGDPVTVPISGVIEGWKHGIEGMKVGGRRRLIVPPEMAYGSKGVTNLIPPGATLVFEVELCGFER